MKILVLGGTGMLGHRLWLDLSKKHQVAAVIRANSPFPNLKSFKVSDITNISEVEKVIQEMKPDVVINCIGLIKQVADHNNTIMNIELNALLPNQLSKLCEKYKSRFIHMSTDCVFSGKKGMYKDFDFADADDIYGRTKKLGEICDLEHVLTIRTSIIGRELRGRSSLVEWFLAQEGKEVKGFRKAIFSGFPTRTIGVILEKHVLHNSSLHGVFNVSADPIDKFSLLNLIKNEKKSNVEIIPDDDFEIDRSLDSSRFRNLTHFKPLPWGQLIKDVFINDINY